MAYMAVDVGIRGGHLVQVCRGSEPSKCTAINYSHRQLEGETCLCPGPQECQACLQQADILWLQLHKIYACTHFHVEQCTSSNAEAPHR